MYVMKQGAEIAQLGILMGWTTLLFTFVMLAWAWWAWSPSRRDQIDRAAHLPLED